MTASNAKAAQISKQRTHLAAELRKNKSFAKVGAALGVSAERAWQLVQKAERDRSLPAWAQGLDIQTANILVQKGFKSREDVRAALERGEYINRISTKRLAQLREWLEG